VRRVCVTAVSHTVTQHVWVSQELAVFGRAHQYVSLGESFQESPLVFFILRHAMALFHNNVLNPKTVFWTNVDKIVPLKNTSLNLSVTRLGYFS